MNSSLRVTIHRGSRQIGGSCVEIATENHRVLIDAGTPLDDSAPRELPPIAGVSLPGKPPDALLLSHAHIDHSGLISKVPSVVPVYLTKGTSKMLQAGHIFCGQTKLPRERECKLTPRRAERIGDITVTALPVDHSIFGAVAFLIEAAGRRVLYSGDLRLHGREPWLTRDLIAAAGAAPLDLLLIEGTHLSRRLDAIATTEPELEEKITDLVAAAPSLALAFLSPQHIQRLLGFYHAACHTGRTFVVDSYTAFVLHGLRFEPGVPDPAKSPGLRVRFIESQPHIPQVEKRVTHSRITLDEVLAKPERHVLLCRPNMIKHDLGGTVPAKTLGLYSMWHGYLNRKDDWRKTQRIIAEAGGDFVQCHTSGHATVPDLVKLINDLRPRRIVPIHTERPEVLKELVPNVEIAEDGVAILV